MPVRSPEDISKHGRKPGDPDWWVVAKDPDWSPPRTEVRKDALNARSDERGKPDTKPEDLRPKTRETVDRLSKEVPGIESLNVNSGLRPGDAGPHGDGRAVDIHEVNGVRLETVARRTDAEAEQTRQDVKRIEAWARENPDIQVFLSPDGGFIRDPKSGEIVREATRDEIKGHKNHIHITVRK